jgi:ABC-type phosphate/phosphonate transport system substrate-binding protein
MAGRLPADRKAGLRRAFVHMHEDHEGQAILANGLIERFVEVEDSDYNPIREMTRRAEAAGFLELK